MHRAVLPVDGDRNHNAGGRPRSKSAGRFADARLRIDFFGYYPLPRHSSATVESAAILASRFRKGCTLEALPVTATTPRSDAVQVRARRQYGVASQASMLNKIFSRPNRLEDP